MDQHAKTSAKRPTSRRLLSPSRHELVPIIQWLLSDIVVLIAEFERDWVDVEFSKLDSVLFTWQGLETSGDVTLECFIGHPGRYIYLHACHSPSKTECDKVDTGSVAALLKQTFDHPELQLVQIFATKQRNFLWTGDAVALSFTEDLSID